MILPKYAFRHSQRLYDIVKVRLWGGRKLHDCQSMPSDTARNFSALSKCAFGVVRVSMILPKYAYRHSQKLYDIVKVCLWGAGFPSFCQGMPPDAARDCMILLKYAFAVGRELHEIAKVCLQTQPETISYCQSMPLGGRALHAIAKVCVSGLNVSYIVNVCPPGRSGTP